MNQRNDCLPGIRRPSRLDAVWLSYHTRWLFWLSAVGYGLIFGLVAWHFSVVPRNEFRSADPSAPSPRPDAWFFPKQADSKIDWTQLRSLSLIDQDSCKPLFTPGAIPRLESLTILGNINDEQLAQICDLYELKSLTLYNIDNVTVDGFDRLKNETQLEYLRINGLGSLLDVPALDWPPNLRTLVCDDAHGMSLTRLNEWRELRHLTCLSTRLVLLDHLQPQEKIQALRSFPGLKQLYVQDLGRRIPFLKQLATLNFEQTFPGAEALQAKLPNFQVRPTAYDPVRVQAGAWILIGGIVAIVLLSIQLTTQFMTIGSLLAPCFLRSHLRPVIAAYFAITIVSFHLYLVVGCGLFVAAGLCGLSAFVLAMAVKLGQFAIRISDSDSPAFKHPGFIVRFIPLAIAGVLAAAIGTPSEFDWFLRGQNPWLNLFFLIGSIGGAFSLVMWVTSLRREIESADHGTISLSILDASEVERTMHASTRQRPVGLDRAFDTRMDRVIEQLSNQEDRISFAFQNLDVTISANDLTRRTIVPIVITGTCLGQYVISNVSSGPGLNEGLPPLILSVSVMQTLVSAASFYALMTQSRSYQEMGLLRPQRRRNWTGLWFRWLAYKVSIDLLIWVAFSFVAICFGALGNFSAMDAVLPYAMYVGLTGLTATVILFALTLRSIVTTILTGVITLCVVSICATLSMLPVLLRLRSSMTPPISGEWTIHEWTMFTTIPAIAAVYVFAFAGFWLAWWRWQNWEIGGETCVSPN